MNSSIKLPRDSLREFFLYYAFLGPTFDHFTLTYSAKLLPLVIISILALFYLPPFDMRSILSKMLLWYTGIDVLKVAGGGMPPEASPATDMNQALSGLFGSISLVAWIFLLMPQFYENYRTSSADGLSMSFLLIWFVGDVTSLAGALLTGLAPSIVIVGIYFCIADFILIGQCLYYNSLNKNRMQRRSAPNAHQDLVAEGADTVHPEQRPLLRHRRSSSVGLTESQRHHSAHEAATLDSTQGLATGNDEARGTKAWVANTMSLLAVILIGAFAWFISWRFGPTGRGGALGSDIGSGQPGGGLRAPWVDRMGIALGYVSAFCYLVARIPQIIKNWKEKSCEGLAMLFFLLSILGNLTYGMSVIAFSQEKTAILAALPWLIGSLGTIAEDILIFTQFIQYAGNANQLDVESGRETGS